MFMKSLLSMNRSIYRQVLVYLNEKSLKVRNCKNKTYSHFSQKAIHAKTVRLLRIFSINIKFLNISFKKNVFLPQ